MAEVGRNIEKAAKLLLESEVVAIPTETVYGLAANALDINAISKIFSIKERPNSNPLIIHIASQNELSRYVKSVPERLLPLLDKFWPGPLTVLLDKNEVIPDLVNAGMPKVAVRVPDHKLTLELLANLNLPLAAPSANPFGYISPTTPHHVQVQLGQKIPYILDGGECTIGLESTIVGLEDQDLIVYRLGGIPLEALMANYDGIIKIQNKKDHAPNAPGMLPYHYSPKTKLILINSLEEIPEDCGNVGLIYHTASWETSPYKHTLLLDPKDEFQHAGRRLYHSLHDMDQKKIDLIAIQIFPNTGLGRTINDRLSRAEQRRK